MYLIFEASSLYNMKMMLLIYNLSAFNVLYLALFYTIYESSITKIQPSQLYCL
jgi:hypothetical protein